MIQNDAALIDRVLVGDKSAFGPLIDRHWSKALSLALHPLGSLADAEDIVQEAFLQAFLRLPSLQTHSRFRPWLLGIVLNLCRMHKRARRSEVVFDEWIENHNGVLAVPEWTQTDLQPSPEAICTTHEAHRTLLAAVDTLPTEQQRAVKVRLHRARARLRQDLTGEELPVQIQRLALIEENLMTTIDAQDTALDAEELRLPVVPTRDIIIFPHMIVPLFIGRQKSLRAFQEAAATHKTVVLTAQRDAMISDPTDEDLYQIGTIASVTRLLYLPDGTIKVVVEGQRRGWIRRYLDQADFFLAEIEKVEEKYELTNEVTQLMLNVTAAFMRADLTLKKAPLPAEISLTTIGDPPRLADTITSHLNISQQRQQKLLETIDPVERLRQILSYLFSTPNWPVVQLRAETQIPASDVEVVLREYVGGWAARHIPHILDAVTDDFLFDNCSMALPVSVRGKVQFQEYLTSLFTAFPDLQFATTNRVAAEEQVWIEWILSGTHQGPYHVVSPTGKKIGSRGAAIFHMRDGKVSQVRVYWEAGYLLRQLRASP